MRWWLTCQAALQVQSIESVAHALADQLVVDPDLPGAAAKDARAADILAAVWTNANATLTAIRQTAVALEAVEHAAEAIEKAKGLKNDTVRSPEQRVPPCKGQLAPQGCWGRRGPHADAHPALPAGSAGRHCGHAGGHGRRG